MRWCGRWRQGETTWPPFALCFEKFLPWYLGFKLRTFPPFIVPKQERHTDKGSSPTIVYLSPGSSFFSVLLSVVQESVLSTPPQKISIPSHNITRLVHSSRILVRFSLAALVQTHSHTRFRFTSTRSVVRRSEIF